MVSLGVKIRLRGLSVGDMIVAINVRCFMIVNSNFKICYSEYGCMPGTLCCYIDSLTCFYAEYMEIKFMTVKSVK